MSLLQVSDLCLAIGESSILHGMTLSVEKGEFLALVGESGSGKSVTALSVMGLLPANAKITSGSIRLLDRELVGMKEKELDSLRGTEAAIIFQDALTSLNPVLTIGDQITETLRVRKGFKRKEADRRALELLQQVGLPAEPQMLKRYPHTLSGGQRQRVCIAMALALSPALLIADEPTTALDVTVQAQIMELLGSLQEQTGMSVLFITHDIALAARQAHRIAVAWQGRVVETGTPDEIFQAPNHEYTKRLTAAAEKLRLP